MLIRKTRIPVFHILFIGMLPSFLKKFVYRLQGYRIGPGVKLRPGAVVIGKKVEISKGVSVGFLTLIRAREIFIGRHVKIGSLSVLDTEKIFVDEDARINEQVYVGGMKTPRSSLHLGKRAIIMQLSYINPTLPVYIGDDSGIGGHCLLFTHGSWNSQLEGYPVQFAPIHIGSKVWLPWRVFVMPGVKIGDGSVIGAGSLVTSTVPPHSLAAGSPAKVLRENYPATPADADKRQMILNILGEFSEWLTWSGFSITKREASDGCILEIRGRKNGTVVFRDSWTGEKAERNAVLMLFRGNEQDITGAQKAGFRMVLVVETPLRRGGCDSGEELVSFCSRYGLRFPRSD